MYDLTEIKAIAPRITWLRRGYDFLIGLIALALLVVAFKTANIWLILLSFVLLIVLVLMLFILRLKLFVRPWIRRYNSIMFTYREDENHKKCLDALMTISKVIPNKRCLLVWQAAVVKCLYRLGYEREAIDVVDELIDQSSRRPSYQQFLIGKRNDLLTNRRNMFKFVNPDRLIGQIFFQRLFYHLHEYPDSTLRQIKATFPDVKNLDKHLESYIEAGYIRRENRRYQTSFPILDEAALANLTLDTMAIVDVDSPVYQQLSQRTFSTSLDNATNGVIITEHVDFFRDTLTLCNYFYKLQKQLPLSAVQQDLYQILGDVNQVYAMKYLTSILLKFSKQPVIMQKRSDIFVDSLVLLGYLIPDEAPFKYRLGMDFDAEHLIFRMKKSS